MNARMIRVVGLATLGSLLAVGGLLAIVRTVDDDAPADFSSIQPAINASSSGDIVQVRCGLYAENLNMKNGVSVIAVNGPECTIIDGSQSGPVVTFTNISGVLPTEFSGFTVRNGRSSMGGGMFLSSSTPIISRNRIVGNTAVKTPGGFYGFGGGISFYNSAGIVTNNQIVGNTAERSGGGIDLYFSYPALTSNTIVGNAAAAPPGQTAYGGGLYGIFSAPAVNSNVIVDNTADAGGGGADLVNSSATSIQYSDTFQNLPVNISGAFTAGSGNFSADPFFLQPPTVDVCVRSDSPVLDAGDPAGTLDLTDYYWRPRHIDGDFDGILGDGARLDVGACEGGEITRLAGGVGGAFSWDPSINSSAVFNLYRSVLSVFLASCTTTCVYTQDPGLVAGAHRECDLAAPMFTDTAVPPPGEAYIYRATGEDVIEGILGFAGDGSILSNDNPCP